MDKAWSRLSERQVLKTTIKDGRVGVRWDVDDWIQYIGDQRDVKPVPAPVAIFGSLGVCIYVPASRHWLISYSPIHLT